jgi:SAM-dependent methyltransferase
VHGLVAAAARPYARPGPDLVRKDLEESFFARLLRQLLELAPGRDVLDLGCGDGLVARLGGGRLTRYVGVDLQPPPSATGVALVAHDLRDGLGPVGGRPFDVYLGTFGIASHLSPPELRRVLREIAAHARPGAIVALEALGLYSLEWPRLWALPPGPARAIPYRLAADVTVHPWSAAELAALLEECRVAPLWSRDRSLQAGPKCGEGRYWPGLPPLRAALDSLLRGGPAQQGRAGSVQQARAALAAPLPPLPAGDAALVHHTLAAHRRELARRRGPAGPALARAVWALEPPTGAGYGHGVTVVGRVI